MHGLAAALARHTVLFRSRRGFYSSFQPRASAEKGLIWLHCRILSAFIELSCKAINTKSECSSLPRYLRRLLGIAMNLCRGKLPVNGGSGIAMWKSVQQTWRALETRRNCRQTNASFPGERGILPLVHSRSGRRQCSSPALMKPSIFCCTAFQSVQWLRSIRRLIARHPFI